MSTEVGVSGSRTAESAVCTVSLVFGEFSPTRESTSGGPGAGTRLEGARAWNRSGCPIADSRWLMTELVLMHVTRIGSRSWNRCAWIIRFLW